jgi:hypothetical protein
LGARCPAPNIRDVATDKNLSSIANLKAHILGAAPGTRWWILPRDDDYT